jgi:hypothetical protein
MTVIADLFRSRIEVEGGEAAVIKCGAVDIGGRHRQSNPRQAKAERSLSI